MSQFELPLMKGAVADVSQAIGNTPIVRLDRLAAGLKSSIYCKLEYLNPAGSMKDRIALNMINEAEKRGELKPGGTIVEATSGNTGMGLAMIAALRGYKCIFVMPDKQSMEKVKALRAAGPRWSSRRPRSSADDPRSYYAVSRRIASETPNSFYANQYHNQDNPQAHYRSTGPEIWSQTGGEIDAFVAGLGTGGTITGTGAYLKERKPGIQLVGADVFGSVYTEFWRKGEVVPPYSYKVEGIGEDFFPSTINLGIIDHIEQLTDKECFDTTRSLARFEGIYTGGSGGAAVKAALKYAERLDGAAKNILVLLPDSANRYLNKIFDDDWMREHGFLDPDEGLGTIRDLLGNKNPAVYTVKKDGQDPRGRRADEGQGHQPGARAGRRAPRRPGDRVPAAAGPAGRRHREARRALLHRDDRPVRGRRSGRAGRPVQPHLQPGQGHRGLGARRGPRPDHQDRRHRLPGPQAPFDPLSTRTMSPHDARHHFETLAIHAGNTPDPTTGAVNVPVYLTSTYVQSGPGVHKGYEYSRTGNPTRTALEQNLAALEGGRFGLCFAAAARPRPPSRTCSAPGSHMIVADDVYGGTFASSTA
jgi:cystathionine beta-synthase